LQELETRIGDLTAINMSLAGFVQWEERTAWRDLPAPDRDVQFSRVYYIFVCLLAAMGQYRQAIYAAERSANYTGDRSVDLAQQTRVPIALAHASALFEAGELDEAADLLQHIGRQVEDASRPGWRVAWLEASGRLDLAHGVFASALARFDDVLRLCRNGGFRQAEVTAHINCARVLILVNRIRDALGHLDEAEQNVQVVGDIGAMERIGFLRSLADARRRSLTDGVSLELSVTETLRPRRRANHPLPIVPEPLNIPQSACFLNFFDDRALEVQWLLADGEFQDALTRFEELEQTFGDTQSRLIGARLSALRGLLSYYAGDAETALAELQRAAKDLASMRLTPELWQVTRVQGWCAARLHRAEDERTFVQRAETFMEEIASSLQGAERAIFLLNKWTADEEYLAHEITQLIEESAAVARSTSFIRPFAWMKMARRLNRLLARIDTYKALVAQNAIGSDESAARGATGPSLLARLLSGERHRVFISFLVLPDQVLVVRSGFCHLDFHVSSITRVALREHVRRWHERAQLSRSPRDLGVAPNEPRAGRANDEGIEAALANALQLPALVAALPSRTTALTIVPDDALHGFPFAATSIGPEKLIDRYAVSIGFASSSTRRHAAGKMTEGLLVAVSHGTAKIPPLPQTVVEVKRVRAWLERCGVQSRVLIDSDATKSRVLEGFGRAAICHFACHGTFAPDEPDASGMVLIPDSESAQILSLRELAGVQLSNCQHITLSSCWSADNFILPGRWIVSLPETLYRSGAQSILACTWPVDDRVAQCFMARFYGRLSHLSRVEALRQTQLECRAGALPGCDVDARDPFHWAGFCLFGEVSSLSPPTPSCGSLYVC
jgi:tetratricopeptide (TPR) repeat protein